MSVGLGSGGRGGAGRGVLGALVWVALSGCACGPESTTARLTAIEPFDPQDCEYEQRTDGRGDAVVEHPLFGCVAAADLVRIRFALGPDSDGRAREGFVYGNGNGTQYTPRAVLDGRGVGDTLPATYAVEHPLIAINGSHTVIAIPALDERVHAATPPLSQRSCSGSEGAD